VTKCIERDRLVACLAEEIRENYNDIIDLHYYARCIDVHWDGMGQEDERCSVVIQRTNAPIGEDSMEIQVKKLFVAADGASSMIRNRIRSLDSRYYLRQRLDYNRKRYRTIPFELPANQYRRDVNYAGAANNIYIDALPTKEGKHLAVLIYKPEEQKIRNIQSSEDAKSFFNKYYPSIAPYIKDDDYGRFAKKPDSIFPKFSYFGPYLHFGKYTVLMGDSAHTVKPFFGFGVNAALEDVRVLSQSLDMFPLDIPNALERYSKIRAPEAEALVKIAQGLDTNIIVLATTLILDSILHKVAPFLFENNILSALQDRSRSYSDLWQRKQRDRLLQLVLFLTSCGLGTVLLLPHPVQ
jgi:kynurenine 3-monooxygenase